MSLELETLKELQRKAPKGPARPTQDSVLLDPTASMASATPQSLQWLHFFTMGAAAHRTVAHFTGSPLTLRSSSMARSFTRRSSMVASLWLGSQASFSW